MRCHKLGFTSTLVCSKYCCCSTLGSTTGSCTGVATGSATISCTSSTIGSSGVGINFNASATSIPI